MGSTDAKSIGNIPRNLDRITLGIDVGTEMGHLDGSFYGYNNGKVEGLLLGD